LKGGKAAIYCRLSKEDLDKDPGRTMSESIKNQRTMLEAYALEKKWEIHDFYIDEDYSGSDRDRPEFNRLITDCLLGRFNIVLCKKQSRFARDIEYVEKYVHGLFSERQIRFIAVLDNIDTGMVSRSVRKASQINSLVDEWYLSDLSENIISALNTKRKNAEFIGSWAPYGYRKSPENKNTLTIDPEAAENVRMIYQWYLNGWGISRIAGELNARQVPNPLLYKQLKGEKINPNPDKLTEKRYLWSPSSISGILHNQTYQGFLVQGKYKKASYKSKKLIRIPSSDWIVIPGCHEAIIDKNTWETVNKRLESKCRASPLKQNHIAAGKVYCGECGSRLVLSGGRSGKRKTDYYCCSMHKLSSGACLGSRIERVRLEQILLNQIRSLASQYFDSAALLEQLDQDSILIDSERSRLNAELNTLRKRFDNLVKQKETLYSDRLNGIVNEEQYLIFKERLENQTELLRLRREEAGAKLSEINEEINEPNYRETLLEHFKTPVSLTRDMVDGLVDSVYVYRHKKGEPGQITINWNF